MSYELTKTAENELTAILDFIADRDGPRRALHVYEQFEQAFEMLGQTPGAGAIRRDLTGDDVRWWSVYKFMVLYEPTATGVMVLRVIHGARDLESMFDSGLSY